MCGGTATFSSRCVSSRGLSPRVRGNPTASQGTAAYAGSIPACAGEPPPDWRKSLDGQVYPRVCGGTRLAGLCLLAADGLSPRVRGNPLPPTLWLWPPGSIPACAGEPRKPAPAHRTRQVYPRVCGGTQSIRSSGSGWRGLSPRVRGNPAGTGNPAPRTRSIPACAGEPPVRRRSTGFSPVYPRVCGGTPESALALLAAIGLSPRVRGNQPYNRGIPTRGRSIPACAGEPPAHCAGHCFTKVYPRVCGGTLVSLHSLSSPPGLSPRVRGNQLVGGSDVGRMGSIPACAGEPGDRHYQGPGVGVYPRVCGGTTCCKRRRYGIYGLSPRVRGNPHRAGMCVWWPRSIPACAGEPGIIASCGSTLTVYPRVCGGTPSSLLAWRPDEGLSPRVRGNRVERFRSAVIGGSIPACAGEPQCGLLCR